MALAGGRTPDLLACWCDGIFDLLAWLGALVNPVFSEILGSCQGMMRWVSAGTQKWAQNKNVTFLYFIEASCSALKSRLGLTRCSLKCVFYDTGFRAPEVVQGKSITQVAPRPWGLSPGHLLPLWEQSRQGFWASLTQFPLRLMHSHFSFSFPCVVYPCSVWTSCSKC